jgi:hypothetical protein
MPGQFINNVCNSQEIECWSGTRAFAKAFISGVNPLIKKYYLDKYLIRINKGVSWLFLS